MYNRHNYIIKIPSWIWLTHKFGWQILSLIVQQRLNMCKQLACMTDQVTDNKSGIQSGLFTDCVQIALLVYNLTIGQMHRSGGHRPTTIFSCVPEKSYSNCFYIHTAWSYQSRDTFWTFTIFQHCHNSRHGSWWCWSRSFHRTWCSNFRQHRCWTWLTSRDLVILVKKI